MSIVFLNGQFVPMEEAKISPMDRGFLFGDGIYEVIPSYSGKLVGFGLHISRMKAGLEALSITFDWSLSQWQELIEELLQRNEPGNKGIYLHVSRGADVKRYHAYPQGIEPTIFAFIFDIPPEPIAEKDKARVFTVCSANDKRWKRSHIKSTSLLGNVMHFQQSVDAGVNETILFNEQNQLTEASACNVFIVKDKQICTPPLDDQILPGVTRKILLEVLRKNSDYNVFERVVSRLEVEQADEIWLTSSSKEIAPVIQLDNNPVGNGEVGDVWLHAQRLFTQYKFDF